MKENGMVILYEGNSIEIMQLVNILKENNISALSDEDNWGGLNPGLKAKILINENDRERALNIINPIIEEWETEADIPDGESGSNTDLSPEPEYTPTAGIDESELPPRTRAVLSEIRLQENRKLNAFAKVSLLLISLFIFYHLKVISSDPGNIVSLLIVIFIHELGHYITMKLFGYKDLKMFFIPMFGAAVSGKETNPGEVKRAVVSLMGPLPGILIGFVFLVVYAKTGQVFLRDYAILSLFINGFNLLPFYPLDGGQYFGSILFSRHVAFEVLFKIFGIIGLIFLAIVLKAWLLLLLVYFIIVSIPLSMRVAKLTDSLRKDGIEATNDVKLPHGFIVQMVPRFEKELKSKSINSKTMAAYISQVWIKLKIKKPSVFASIGFTLLYLFIIIFLPVTTGFILRAIK